MLVLTHTGAVRRIEFSPDGQRGVRPGSSDGSARLWDATTGRSLHSLVDGEPVPVQETLFSPAGDQVLTVGADDSVRLWDASTGRLSTVLRRPASAVLLASGYRAAFSPDGGLIAVAGQDGVVRVWRARGGEAVSALTGRGAPITSMSPRPMAAPWRPRSADATAVIWEVASGERRAVLSHKQAVNSVVYSADGERVLTASEDGTATIWDWRAARPLTTLTGHLAAINIALFSPDGQQIATASTDATVQLWDAKSGRRLARRLGHAAAVLDLRFNPSGRRLVSGCGGGKGIVWTTEPQQRITLLGTGPTIWAEFSADGTRVVSTAQDGIAQVFDTALASW